MTRNEVIEKWCAALRSGVYQRGTGVLYNPGDNTFCCLGVLGSAVCALPIGGGRDLSEYGRTNYLTDDDWLACGFPAYIMVDGFDTDVQGKLAELNDTGGMTFAQIADWIEEHLKEPTNANG